MRVLVDKDSSQKLTSNSFLLDDDMRYYSLSFFLLSWFSSLRKLNKMEIW